MQRKRVADPARRRHPLTPNGLGFVLNGNAVEQTRRIAPSGFSPTDPGAGGQLCIGNGVRDPASKPGERLERRRAPPKRARLARSQNMRTVGTLAKRNRGRSSWTVDT